MMTGAMDDDDNNNDSNNNINTSAVRFGRIPKKEKLRMLSEMQSVMNHVVNDQLQNRSGIEDVASVEQLQENLIRALRSLVGRSGVFPSNNLDSPRFTKLLLKLPDLRTLNNMHSEKLLSFCLDA
ncbi:hypothetical protein F2P81_015424 [Scophthalmus maximus]|uniref:NR LBD domain-containing protein n=1 Tax=Scophthalmus maximus TaxID=52904 RepID=A0A6A4SPZ1_SCOMX|nr:hypothetical protein F2P81_015424 [Scophthalmus maximus]